jgi:hypothetical protein
MGRAHYTTYINLRKEYKEKLIVQPVSRATN